MRSKISEFHVKEVEELSTKSPNTLLDPTTQGDIIPIDILGLQHIDLCMFTLVPGKNYSKFIIPHYQFGILELIQGI